MSKASCSNPFTAKQNKIGAVMICKETQRLRTCWPVIVLRPEPREAADDVGVRRCSRKVPMCDLHRPSNTSSFHHAGFITSTPRFLLQGPDVDPKARPSTDHATLGNCLMKPHKLNPKAQPSNHLWHALVTVEEVALMAESMGMDAEPEPTEPKAIKSLAALWPPRQLTLVDKLRIYIMGYSGVMR